MRKSLPLILAWLFLAVFNTVPGLAQVLAIARPDNLPEALKNHSLVKRIAAADQNVTGTITSKTTGEPLPGVTIVLKGTTNGTTTGLDGKFSLSVPSANANGTLVISFIGYLTKEVPVPASGNIAVALEDDSKTLGEVVVVGYGTQKKSDITGAVASISKDRLEMLPNVNVAQAIQGAVPGVMIQTGSAGAAPSQALMIRGRNSIKASNDPLIVVDGIPYSGQISDINPNDIKSIEILKDASSAAIYGSRGANGVILITSKEGVEGKATISYDGKYSIQEVSNMPDLMTGPEFYQFKLQREPNNITQTEKEVYESGEWTDWADLATRTGSSQQHNLSVSGGTASVKYYVAGGLLDVKGVQVNDNYKRLTSRVNLDIKINKWLKLGTRTNLSYEDKSGQAPSTGVHRMNPLTRPFDENGNQKIYPWPEDIYFENPLENLLFEDKDKSYQVVTNNYAIVEVPFVPGLSYRANSGIRMRAEDNAYYAGRNTGTGFEVGGQSSTNRAESKNIIFENIFSYTRDFGKHNIFATGLYSFEENESGSNRLNARGFPHDFLSWYAATQAKIITPSYTYDKTSLISQMLRLNYSYDSRYLITLTGRRDGFSGFGSERKWGVFPSVALGWNIANEKFFPWKDKMNELKLRTSIGLNGNQAVGAYETISKLGSYDIIANKATLPGYVPIALGQNNLGWESSRTMNIGLDWGFNRVFGDINLYKTNTTDLLLNRTISPVHGITAITQNIGETENRGVEVSVTTTNIDASRFKWTTSGNFSYNQNRILSLYGTLDENGNEINDVANAWFIGQPIRINYNYVMAGVWQLNEAEQAKQWKSQPGFVKFKDVNGDGLLSATEDREIIGQQDPKALWGLTNSFSYGNFKLTVFVHGVHGVTKANELMVDDVYETVRRNTIKKNWWTSENPTNDFYMNHKNANILGGDESSNFYYENASFVRLKDVSLSYDLPPGLLGKAHIDRLRVYVTGRNLYTITDWRGMDPEINDQRGTPMQKEYVLGLTLGF
ncbi:SusC/RagA family TonB-linked outer membrane protein [Adhaeribacter aerolatus]|uniref:SusC/RagA family TonB-linked outer membrane protein n=1 Tax=Adhaeribacter aerolatus TaxID=670289 RepID=A0A512AVK1_9BACT|nr:TonB-dependent receptor [Adhaeribacter aerolatus]GEO03733.1 SusC/RagA family TonB-linked outer membrane protein [Adhaeribacter aerolatus]